MEKALFAARPSEKHKKKPEEARRVWSCAACAWRWMSRLKRPPVCPRCFERHYDEPEYLRARAKRRAA